MKRDPRPRSGEAGRDKSDRPDHSKILNKFKARNSNLKTLF